MGADQPELTVADQDAWREWLDAHHGDSDGVWLLLAKQGSTDPTSLTYAQALEEALCHGWIDSQARSRDETTYRQRFTPRRSTSPWSARNVTLVADLIATGRMRPGGHAEIERAKADGRWDAAYAGPATAEVPADLAAALDAEPRARAMFDILTKQNRFSVIYRVDSAKRAETRARRIAQFVEMLARGETVYPQKRRLED
ncbi:YdeI/OmpD-associated family protein [Micromonospora sp. NPDC004704]